MPDFTLSHADDPKPSTEQTEQRQTSLDTSLAARTLAQLVTLELSQEQVDALAAMLADYRKQAIGIRLIDPLEHEPPVMTHDPENQS